MSPTSDAFRKMNILALLVGVTIRVAIASAETDQSESATPQDMVIPTGNVGERQIAPEVFLQLKYDEGELKRIYLTQFRKPGKVWSPSVTDRSNLCADLCHAGLGGRACGSSCSQLIPMGLHSTLSNSSHEHSKSKASITSVQSKTPGQSKTSEQWNSAEHPEQDIAEHNEESDAMYGQPRVAVCPTLCDNFMGEPLCQCQRRHDEMFKVDWEAICEAFCLDGYNLGGCPTCPSTPTNSMMLRQRLLDTAEGWAAWCDVQCRQGHGGAACNCDRTPF